MPFPAMLSLLVTLYLVSKGVTAPTNLQPVDFLPRNFYCIILVLFLFNKFLCPAYKLSIFIESQT